MESLLPGTCQLRWGIEDTSLAMPPPPSGQGDGLIGDVVIQCDAGISGLDVMMMTLVSSSCVLVS